MKINKYIKNLIFIGIFSDLFLFAVLLYSCQYLNNEFFFCIIFGIILSYSILCIHLYIVIILMYQFFTSLLKKNIYFFYLLLSFILCVLFLLSITLSYQKLILGVFLGIMFPMILVSVYFMFSLIIRKNKKK